MAKKEFLKVYYQESEKFMSTYFFTKIDGTHIYMYNYTGSEPQLVTSEEIKNKGYVLHIAQLKGFTTALYQTVLDWLQGGVS